MIQCRLGRPAYIEGRRHVRTSPIEDLGQLVPIPHLLEWHPLYRRPSDDHTVVKLVSHTIEIPVELAHMLHRRVLGRVAFDFHQLQLHL